MLYAQIGSNNATFDLNGNGTVENSDITSWLTQASAIDPLGRTFRPGDIDLNGRIEGADFTALAAHFGITGGRWGDGNFDGSPNNFDVGGSDFTTLAAGFGFTSPLHGVPEPAAGFVILLGAVMVSMRLRR